MKLFSSVLLCFFSIYCLAQSPLKHSDTIQSPLPYLKNYTLADINIKSKKKKQIIEIGKYKAGKIHTYYGLGGKIIRARFFKFENQYTKTPFLKTLTVFTWSRVRNAKFSIRFFSVNENRSPGSDLINEKIIVTSSKGWGNLEIDVSRYNLLFPKNGIFIAIEGLNLPENEFLDDEKIKGQIIKEKRNLYQPMFGGILGSIDEIDWVFDNGSWKKSSPFPTIRKMEKGMNINLAMKLTLTN